MGIFVVVAAHHHRAPSKCADRSPHADVDEGLNLGLNEKGEAGRVARPTIPIMTHADEDDDK